ncbi:MAG TPA: helix-turn-helix domain-containing protein [Thermoplasmata archaeon]|nr:helix-turn-helix domain-containing protein [Thermoplasmata archaeon]
MPRVVPGYKVEARARIVEAAKRLFVTRGYRRTTMDDVAEALGVSKGALYLYYRSKVDLLRETQAQNRRLARQWMDTALQDRTAPATMFFHAFDDLFDRWADREQIALYFEILGEASHDEEIREAIRIDHREDLKSLQRFLQELRRRGALASRIEPDVLAFMVLALFQGAVWDLSIGADRDRTRRVLRRSIGELLAPPQRRTRTER